jgi:MarR family
MVIRQPQAILLQIGNRPLVGLLKPGAKEVRLVGHVYGLIGRIQMQCTAFIEEALEPFGLTRGTFDVLTALRRAGSPYCLSPKQIAQSLLLSGAGLTSRLNKLEAQNLLARLPEPNVTAAPCVCN